MSAPNVTRSKANVLGMEIEMWAYKGCIAQFSTGPDWATLYFIESSEPSKGHATTLLLEAKRIYTSERKNVYGSVPLNARMASLYEKVGISVAVEDENIT